MKLAISFTSKENFGDILGIIDRYFHAYQELSMGVFTAEYVVAAESDIQLLNFVHDVKKYTNIFTIWRRSVE